MTCRRTLAIAALLAGLFATIALRPMVAHPESTLCAYDHPGDAMISIWSTWLRLEALAGRWSMTPCPLVAAPEGVDFRTSPPEPVIEWPLLLLARAIGEIRAFNLWLWLTFPLAAATMALLVLEASGRPMAAIVAGVLYACAPYHFAHTLQLSLASIQWLPLGLWSWLVLAKTPNARSAVLHAACSGLIVWTTAYYGFLFAVASGVMVLWLMSSRHPWAPTRRLFLGWGAAAIGLVGACSLLWYAPFLRSLRQAPPVAWETRYAWPLKHLFVYAAKPWDYLVPSMHHPWWGPVVAPWTVAHLYGSNVVEQTLYVGLAALALAGWGVVRRRAAPAGERSAITLFIGLGLVGLWYSAPPLFPLGSFRIEHDRIIARTALYFPSALLHHVLPFFRVYARFGLIVQLAVAALAGLGMARLWDDARGPRWRRRLLLTAVGGILALDYAVAMPFRDVGRAPAVYEWLARQPQAGPIAEYPFLPSAHTIHAEYLFAQRIHRHPMVNGAHDSTAAGQQRLWLANLENPGVPAQLKARGVSLVLVHRNLYRAIPKRPTTIEVLGVRYAVPQRHPDETLPPPPAVIPGLRAVAAFGDTTVYRVDA